MKTISTLCLCLLAAAGVQGQFDINDSLQGWYLFSGNTLDSSGKGNDGILVGPPTLTTDRHGTPNSAYLFDGVDDAIELPSDFDFPERSWVVWLNATSIGATLGVVYDSDHNNLINGKTGLSVQEINGQDSIRFSYAGTTLNFPINENEWYMATTTVVPNDSARIYLNDTWLASIPYSTISSVLGNAYASYGQSRVNDRFINGKIDDGRIYNRAISWCEIRYLYHGDSILPTISVNGFDLTSSGATSYQWNLNDTAINGATSQNHTAVQNGSYTVTVIDSFGCEYTSLPVVITGVGINEQATENIFTIYPNPTGGVATVSVGKGQLAVGKIAVFDLFGRPVPFEFDSGRSLLDVRSSPAGVYFVRMGEAVRKLVKQ